MAKQGVTQTEVHASADRVVARGAKPTVVAVRAELGDRGSNSTILRHLRDWWSYQSAVKIDAPLEIPETLAKTIREALDSTWTAASRIASEEIAAARQVAQKQNEGLEVQLRDAVETIEEMETETENLRSELESTRGRLDIAREQLVARQAELETVRSQMEENMAKTEALLVTRLSALWSQAIEEAGTSTRSAPREKTK